MRRAAPRIGAAACVALLAAVPLVVSPAAAYASVRTAATKKPPTGEIRVVMVYAPPDGSSPSIVVTDDTAATSPSARKSRKKPTSLLTAGFGDVTDFTKVPAGHTLRLAPSDATDPNTGIFIDPLKKGDELTLVPYATDTDPDQSGLQMLTIVEHGKRRDAGDVAEWPQVDSSKATLMYFAGGLLSVVDSFGGFVVTPGTGCLESTDADAQDTGVGGNIPAYYTVDGGSVDVGVADTGGCTGPVVIGPETVDATAGARVVLIPYGKSTSDLQLLVLPVATP
ncbi:MAG TPA: hypothetical protein VH986_10585 [Acidimicrobiia bacterium]